MHDYIKQRLEDVIIAALRTNPAVALLGPRQCGKSTLARKLAELQIAEAYVVAPVPEPYSLRQNVQVLSIRDFIRTFPG
jgi:predicted AAA+ superfamily ATPase